MSRETNTDDVRRRYADVIHGSSDSDDLTDVVAALDAYTARLGPSAIPAPVNLRVDQWMRGTAEPIEARAVAPGDMRRRRHVLTEMGAVAAVLLVAVMATLLFRGVSHDGPPTATSHVTTHGTSPVVAPTTSRATYLGTDGHLHFVSTNGENTIGPIVPEPGFIDDSLPLNNASLSPDGRLLAYSAGAGTTTGSYSGQVTILTTATGALVRSSARALELYWSHDGTHVAAQDALDSGSVSVIEARTGMVTQLALTYQGQSVSMGRLLGWVDATHLAALVHPAPPQADVARKAALLSSISPLRPAHSAFAPGSLALFLGVIDVQSGTVRHVIDVQTPPDVFLAPDGSMALVAANSWNATASRVDLVTGQVTALPAITDTFSGKFVNMDNFDYAHGGNYSMHMAWKPGTHILAVSLTANGIGSEGTVGPAIQPAGVWLLDLDRDTAAQITHNTYPLAWTSDGSALLLSGPALPANGRYPQGGGGVGPTLSVLAPVSAASQPVELASGMSAFVGVAQSR